MDGVEATSLDALLARPATRRRRALRLASMGLVLVGGIALLAQQLLVARGVVAPPTVGTARLVTTLDANTTWGTLTVNGKRLPGPPPQSVTLAAGTTTLTLSAPPFTTETCQIATPAGDTTTDGAAPPTVVRGPCVAAPLSPSGMAVTARTPRAQVTFQLGGGDLAGADRAAAQAVLTQGLSALRLRTTVAPGDYFISGFDAQGNDINVRAPAALTAHLNLMLDPTPRDASAARSTAARGSAWAAPWATRSGRCASPYCCAGASMRRPARRWATPSTVCRTRSRPI